MNQHVSSHFNLSKGKFVAVLLIISLLSACKPEGLINKVKYRGEKYINTCESFTTEINKLIQSNNDPNLLKVSEYDNSDFTYYYLEQGQFEIKTDTLFFRLTQDLEYPHYLDKGIAVHVNASYKAMDNIKDLETDPEGTLGTLVVDREYYVANRKPFFLYKFPLKGKDISGKQLMLSFAIAKYDKNGNVKQFYCESDATPIGTALPSCCSAKPWEAANLQSVVDFPEIQVNDQAFRYKGFTGTIDVIFNESSFSLKDDSAFSTMLIQAYVDKYKNLGYKITNISLSGYASPGGVEKYNQKLSERRATALQEGLKILNGNIEGLVISAIGKGEDWERVKLLTQISSLNAQQKDRVLAIANDASKTNDQKEAQLRKVPFWDTLVEEVLVKARHTFAVMDFAYMGNEQTLDRFEERLPVASDKLEKVATTEIKVAKYQAGKSIPEELARIDDLLTKKATPNLYAMRATYHLAKDDYKMAIEDLEKAARFRGDNTGRYELAVQGYKVLFADNYSFEQKKEMYGEFTKLSQNNPGDRKIFFNRAILMDKIGYISGALAEYKNLLEGNTPNAHNLNNRGVAKLKTNMFTESEADFMSATNMDANLGEAYFNLAAVSAYKGLTKKTIEYLDKAISQNASYKDLIFNNPIFSVMSEDPRFDKYR